MNTAERKSEIPIFFPLNFSNPIQFLIFQITCFPNGIDISDAGDILIGDSHGNRFHVACFSREGILQSEFECPHVKVIEIGRI